MDNTLFAVVVGGLIAAMPGVIAAIANNENAKKQRAHELELRRIELYESRKRDALLGYAKALGQSCYYVAASDYWAAAGEALPFFPQELRDLAYNIGGRIEQGRGALRNHTDEASRIWDFLHQQLGVDRPYCESNSRCDSQEHSK